MTVLATSNRYLVGKVDRYNAIKAELDTLTARAADANRDLTDDEVTQVRTLGDEGKKLYGQITELHEEDQRHQAITAMQASIGRATTGESARVVVGPPPLMPSAEQVAAMVRCLGADQPTPMRFTTTANRQPEQTRAVVTLAGDLGDPVLPMSAPVLPEPRRIATAAGLTVESVAGTPGLVFPVFGAGVAGVAAENVAKTEYDNISPGAAEPQMINAFTDYTRQALLSHGSFEQRLRAKLATLVAAREDVLLQAKVAATAGIQTQAFVAGSQASAVLIGAAKVQSAVGTAPDVALCNPADIGLLFGAGLANTPPAELAQLDLQLFGMRVYPTTAQTAGFVLAGAWRASSRLVVGLDPTYFVDPFTGLKTNRITTLLEEAVDLAVEEPTGFISIDIITP